MTPTTLLGLLAALLIGLTLGLAVSLGLFVQADRCVRKRRAARRRCLYLDDGELVCHEPERRKNGA
jgi:hypothetical protein